MNIVCAKCGTGVAYGLASLANQTVLICQSCRNGLRVTIEAFAVPTANAASPPSAPTQSDRSRAVIAVQGDATRELIGEMLTGAGFSVTEAATGAEAIQHVTEVRPDLLVVDVGLPDMMGFQVCEVLRKNATHQSMKIILVAAIHNKDRYRRQPDNLFGADDYIERHQLESALIPKVSALCGAEHPSSDSGAGQSMVAPRRAVPVPPAVAPLPTAASEVKAEPARTTAPPVSVQMPAPAVRSPEPAMVDEPHPASSQASPAAPVAVPSAAPVTAPAAPAAGDSPVVEAAKRLARIIVSDIALYNAKKVDEGVTNGTFFDLLRAEIEEGRKLYEERKAPELPVGADIYQQTLDQFVSTRRELLKRSRPAA